jgi:antibiotic biosynthesis monooxygenase (ABM) superfamily enzyme
MSSPRSAEKPKGAPPRYKVALITWAGAYAVITTVLAAFGPAIAAWPLPLRTLALSVVMVTTLTWLVIPTLSRAFTRWLFA